MATRSKPFAGTVLLAAALLSVLPSAGFVPTARAQAFGGLGLKGSAEDGEASTEDEYAAFIAMASEEFIRAREEADHVIKSHPESFIAHYILGMVERQAEGNFPRSVFELEKARAAYERKHGKKPAPETARWYQRILLALADSHGDLDHYEKQITLLKEYDALFDPDLTTFRAWPLMKMRRFEEARRIARVGIATNEPNQVSYGLNALCAIEFEAGNLVASYTACEKALEYGRAAPGGPTSVDLTNFAEASRSMFKLDEAERISLEATQAETSWYGNPWIDLADLYTRGARFAEALGALKREPAYRQEKPPHVRDADRNEARRSLAAFYVVVGFAEEALRITEKAIVSPDRRAHQSRDPAQDVLLTALVDRAARRLLAEQYEEEAAGKPFYARPWLLAKAQVQRFQAWLSGRQAAKLLAEKGRLLGSFKIGSKEAAVMPPWLVGDVVEVVGAAIAGLAMDEARRTDDRPASAPYYGAFLAEAAHGRGNFDEALRGAAAAADKLGAGEELLRARLHAIAALSAWELGKRDVARGHFAAALEKDPGVFRRFGVALPVTIQVASSEIAGDVADVLLRTPRFREEAGGLELRIAGDGTACLLAGGASSLGCAGKAEAAEDDSARDRERREARGGESEEARIAAAFLRRVFAPRIDLSHSDAQSLDGQTGISRDPMEAIR
jgi:tetratricopeptide (TPR) repeat protein